MCRSRHSMHIVIQRVGTSLSMYISTSRYNMGGRGIKIYFMYVIRAGYTICIGLIGSKYYILHP